VQASSHAVLLSSAAKRILHPFGLFQKGRSRTWLADHAWWMAVVEFQPSDWSRGSYLNVGCMWLWNTQPHISFDVGYRVEGFSPFDNEEQFGRIADELAGRALEKVKDYRKLFRSIHGVSDYYRRNAPKTFWACFNASLAHSLAGRTKAGTKLLSTCLEGSLSDPKWLKEARSDAQTLSEVIGDEEQFRDIILGRIRETRKQHNLPPLAEIDFNC
jgi:hypothetical protein